MPKTRIGKTDTNPPQNALFLPQQEGQLWESNYLGKDKEYSHIERLANLDRIPRPFRFIVSVLPIKIEAASAGWVRAVAILEDE